MDKIAVVLHQGLSAPQAANAAVVLGLALGGRLDDSVAADSPDASGALHAGLNPIPVPVLAGTSEELTELRDRASVVEGVRVVGFNEVARRSRTYSDYVEELLKTEPVDLAYIGLIVQGPRSAVTKLTKRLALFS